MEYVEPTVVTLKARYPEFSIVDDSLVALVLSEAISSVDDGWCEKDRARAQLLLAAHTLSMEGEPQRSNSIANGALAANPAAGPVVEMRDRDVWVKFAGANSQSKSGNESLSDMLAKTPYGQQYLQILRRNVPSVVAV